MCIFGGCMRWLVESRSWSHALRMHTTPVQMHAGVFFKSVFRCSMVNEVNLLSKIISCACLATAPLVKLTQFTCAHSCSPSRAISLSIHFPGPHTLAAGGLTHHPCMLPANWPSLPEQMPATHPLTPVCCPTSHRFSLACFNLSALRVGVPLLGLLK